MVARRAFVALWLLGLPAATGLAQQPGGYRLRPGDEVAVTVRPRREFDCGGIVLPDGMLFLSNIGGIKAAGLTIPGLAAKIESVLREELNEPRVTVTLTRMAPAPEKAAVRQGVVTVVGAVGRPGPLPLEEGLRLRKAIDLAGGADRDADLARIVIFRKDLSRLSLDLSTDQRVSDPRSNVLLQDGDSVDIRRLPTPPERKARVRIGGAVNTPGSYELLPGMTIEDLILTAGKLLPLADTSAVLVTRRTEKLSIDLIQRRKLGPAGKLLLEDGDEVWIGELAQRYALIGAVTNPGVKPLRPGLRVRDLLLSSDEALANSINPAVVDMDGAQLLRQGQPARRLALSQVLKKPGHRDDVALETGDVLFLPPRRGPKRTFADYLLQFGPLGYLFGVF